MKRVLLLLALASCAHAPEKMSFDEAEQEQFPPQYRRAALEPQLALYRPERFLPPLALTAWPGSTGLAGNANCNNPSATCLSTNFKASDGTAALPSYTFTSDTSMGMYRAAANTVGFGASGLGMISIAPGVTAGGLITGVGTAAQLRLDASTGWQGAFNGSVLTLDSNAATLRNNASGVTALTINAASGQTGNLQDWKINGGAAVTSVAASGAMSIASGGSASFGTFITGPNSNMIGIGTGGRTGFVLNNSLNFTAGGTVFTGLADSISAPTISSGFGTSPSVASSNGSIAFTINVGTGGTATSGVIGLPTATNGWVCQCTDLTTNSATVFITKQTASSTTTCTVGNFNTSAVAAAWAASDILHCMARGR